MTCCLFILGLILLGGFAALGVVFWVVVRGIE